MVKQEHPPGFSEYGNKVMGGALDRSDNKL